MNVTEALRDWFVSAVPGIAGSMDELPAATPHRAFAVQTSGNLGLEGGEEYLTRPSFTLLVRGVNGGDAEEWAFALVNAWIDAPPMFAIGDSDEYAVKGKGMLAGPQRLGRDGNEQYPGRVVWNATLWARIAR